MNACIIYNSKHGTTKAYAEAIESVIKEKGIDTEIFSIEDYSEESLKKADIVLLGAWTHGLMIFAQHPEPAWKKFAQKLPGLQSKKIVLFTTYKLATGSMFRKMESCLSGKVDGIQLILKSKSKKLTADNIKQLEEIVA